MKTLKVLIVTALLSASGLAHSNLIVNGDFEHWDINKGWKYGADPRGGWQGDNIEVWASGFLGVKSFEGEQHGELNAHYSNGESRDGFSIFQSFDTMAGYRYDVKFAYRARHNHNESFRFDIFDDSTSIISAVMDQHIKGEWSHYSGSFWGTGEKTTLSFTALTPERGTVGNFLDAVSVTAVPAPSVLALMCAGAAGFGLSRRSARSRS